MNPPETPPAGGGEPGRGLSGVQRAGIVLGALAVLLIAFVVIRGGDDSGERSSSSAPRTTATQGSASTQTTTGTSSATTTGETATDTETDTESETGESESETGTTATTAPSEPAVETIRVVGGQPQGGVKTVSFKKGDQVRLKVQSDVADEIHVHGYDVKKDVEAGGSVQFDFKATIEGRFEIELENAGTQIANLEVSPS
jgi:heme/copper-type cytochrome/quinol oxidase subunit 2